MRLHPFCYRDLVLKATTQIYEPGPKFTDIVLRYILRCVIRLSVNLGPELHILKSTNIEKHFSSRLSKFGTLQTDRQTDSQTAVQLCTTKHLIPRRPRPVCLQCHLQTTSSLCQPRSFRRASPSSRQLWSARFSCGRPCDMELVVRQSERSGHQQRLLQAFTEDVFIFSLLVYIAH